MLSNKVIFSFHNVSERFNLGFNNRWEKILPKDILDKLNKNLQNELNELGYSLKND